MPDQEDFRISSMTLAPEIDTDSFKIHRLEDFQIDGLTGSLELLRKDKQGADTEAWIFTPENSDSKKIVKFIKEERIRENTWVGDTIEERAKDIYTFFLALRRDIGSETIVDSKVIVCNDPYQRKRVAIIQDLLTQDNQKPKDTNAQLDLANQKYLTLKNSFDFPDRWKRRLYDSLGDNGDVFWVKGKLKIADWF